MATAIPTAKPKANPIVKGLPLIIGTDNYVNSRYSFTGRNQDQVKKLREKIGEENFLSPLARIEKMVNSSPKNQTAYQAMDDTAKANFFKQYTTLYDLQAKQANTMLDTAMKAIQADEEKKGKAIDKIEKYLEKEDAAKQKFEDKKAEIFKQAEAYAREDYKERLAQYKDDMNVDKAKDPQYADLVDPKVGRAMPIRDYLKTNTERYNNEMLSRHGLDTERSDWLQEFGQVAIPSVPRGAANGINAFLKKNPDINIKELNTLLEQTPFDYKPTDLPPEVAKALIHYRQDPTTQSGFGDSPIKQVAPTYYGDKSGITADWMYKAPTKEATAWANELANSYDDQGKLKAGVDIAALRNKPLSDYTPRALPKVLQEETINPNYIADGPSDNSIMPNIFPASQNWSQRFASDFSRQNPELIYPTRSEPAAIPGADVYFEVAPSNANYDYSIDPSYL
jgi:hypothetical protein